MRRRLLRTLVLFVVAVWSMVGPLPRAHANTYDAQLDASIQCGFADAPSNVKVYPVRSYDTRFGDGFRDFAIVQYRIWTTAGWQTWAWSSWMYNNDPQYGAYRAVFWYDLGTDEQVAYSHTTYRGEAYFSAVVWVLDGRTQQFSLGAARVQGGSGYWCKTWTPYCVETIFGPSCWTALGASSASADSGTAAGLRQSPPRGPRSVDPSIIDTATTDTPPPLPAL